MAASVPPPPPQTDSWSQEEITETLQQIQLLRCWAGSPHPMPLDLCQFLLIMGLSAHDPILSWGTSVAALLFNFYVSALGAHSLPPNYIRHSWNNHVWARLRESELKRESWSFEHECFLEKSKSKSTVDADRNQSKTAHFTAAVSSEDTELHRERQREDQYMSAVPDVCLLGLSKWVSGKGFFLPFLSQLNLLSILECNVTHKTFNFPGTKCFWNMLHL